MGFALPAGVVNTSSAYFYGDSVAGNFGIVTKEVSDQVLVVLDYSLITPSVTISSFSFAVDVSSNPALVVAYPQLGTPANVFSFLVSGGIAGQQYNITIALQLVSGPRNDTLTINIPSSGDCDCEQLNPVPVQYTQLPLGTQAYMNTAVRFFWGTAPPTNPNVSDQWYDTINGSLSEWVTNGGTSFWQTLVTGAALIDDAPSGTPTVIYGRVSGYWTPLPIQSDVSGTLLYSRSNASWVLNPIQTDANVDGKLYGRMNGSWQPVPSGGMADVPDNQLYGRTKGLWQLIPPAAILTDAPPDGRVYLRAYGIWANSGTLGGSLAVNGNLDVQNALTVNSYSNISGAATFGSQVTLAYDPIAPLQAVTKQYVDNKFLTLIGASTAYLPLAGGTLTGPLVLAADPTSNMQATTMEYVIGRTPITADAPLDGQIWCRQSGGWVISPSGGMADAPNNAFVYLRGQQGWRTGGTLSGSLTVAGTVTLAADPTTALQAATKHYVDAHVTPPSTALPLMDGVASAGVNSLTSAADHVHPTDTSRYAASNPLGYINIAQAVAAAPVQSVAGRTGVIALTHTDITDWDVTLAPYALLVSPSFTGVPVAPTAGSGTNTNQLATTAFVSNAVVTLGGTIPNPSSLLPLMDGTAAVGVGVTWARADHVHPTDASRVALAGSTMTGPLILSGNPTVALGAVTKQYVDTPTNMVIDCGTF